MATVAGQAPQQPKQRWQDEPTLIELIGRTGPAPPITESASSIKLRQRRPSLEGAGQTTQNAVDARLAVQDASQNALQQLRHIEVHNVARSSASAQMVRSSSAPLRIPSGSRPGSSCSYSSSRRSAARRSPSAGSCSRQQRKTPGPGERYLALCKPQDDGAADAKFAMLETQLQEIVERPRPVGVESDALAQSLSTKTDWQAPQMPQRSFLVAHVSCDLRGRRVPSNSQQHVEQATPHLLRTRTKQILGEIQREAAFGRKCVAQSASAPGFDLTANAEAAKRAKNTADSKPPRLKSRNVQIVNEQWAASAPSVEPARQRRVAFDIEGAATKIAVDPASQWTAPAWPLQKPAPVAQLPQQRQRRVAFDIEGAATKIAVDPASQWTAPAWPLQKPEPVEEPAAEPAAEPIVEPVEGKQLPEAAT